MENKTIKLLPQGISDFRQIRWENKYYVDKTMFLPMLENTSNFLFLVRPRRFGKSLFLTMMRDYYDINNKENFQKEFEGLHIAAEPTELQGTFQVLFFDFSQVESEGDLQRNFTDYCNSKLKDFLDYYADFYPKDFSEEVFGFETLNVRIGHITNYAHKHGHTVYLIVDEYDNFTNTLLSGGQTGKDTFGKITHEKGFYRQTFKAFKPNFDRIIMCGVLPVTLSDLTSGYNIATNISLDSDYNTMLGFSEEDVRNIIGYYQKNGLIKRSEEEIFAEMRPWYDSYCFSYDSLETDPGMYNSNNVLSYLGYLIRKGKSPDSLIDRNSSTDFQKLKTLAEIDSQHRVGENKGVIERIIEKGYILDTLYDEFDASKTNDIIYLPSLMYYNGLLTLGKLPNGMEAMTIPNLNARKLFYDYIASVLEEFAPGTAEKFKPLAYNAAMKGEWRPMFEFAAEEYRSKSNVRLLRHGEGSPQLFLLSLLNMSPYYFTIPEEEINGMYCDLFMTPNKHSFSNLRHSYIIELKNIKTNATQAELDAKWQEACEQVKRYAETDDSKKLAQGTLLHPIVMIFKGLQCVKCEQV